MTNAAQTRDALVVADLRAALDSRADSLEVHYMPTVDLTTGEYCGFEALVRFDDPHLGPISPAVFVPLAEDSGMAGQLGHWVRQRVADDLVSGALTAGRVAVNVSAHELADPAFADGFLDLLEASSLPVGRLGVEVTETAVARHFAESVEALHRLQAAGVPVALDDFGTGHASLEYLARLPCDTVKVDQSFVAGLERNERCQAIVAGVIGMAHGTGHQVIAEGVENTHQLTALTDLGCDEGQGYLFGRATRLASIPTHRAPREDPGYAGSLARHRVSRAGLAPQLLLDLLRDLGQAPDLEAGFRMLIAALRPMVDFTGGSVQLLGHDGIRLAAAHPPATAEAMAARIPAGQGVGGSVIDTGQLRYLPDITVPEAAVAADRRAKATTRHTRSYVAVPLFDGPRPIGLIQLDSVEPEAFDQDIQLLLAGCAGPLGLLLARELRR